MHLKNRGVGVGFFSQCSAGTQFDNPISAMKYKLTTNIAEFLSSPQNPVIWRDVLVSKANTVGHPKAERKDLPIVHNQTASAPSQKLLG